jgi:glycosyltransferase involved in cell wall biosynthesis
MTEQTFGKVAIIHDWLPLIAGAERVLEEMVKLFPHADIFTLFDFLTPEQKQQHFGNATITASYLNRLPKVKKYYRHLLAFCPQAVENFDVSGYDLVISSSHAVAKGVITGPNQTHISYVHSPCRYAWDLTHHYLKQSKMDKGMKGYLAKYMLHKFRIWDSRTPNGVDVFLANSRYIARRIEKTYRREATVVYPPVNVQAFTFRAEKEDFYLAASRMVPYKRLDLIAEAFAQMPDKKLVIIGDGPEMPKVRAAAAGKSNIHLMGFQETAVLRDHMQRASAFVFAAEEDFGIIPVEAQACGTPVIAYGAGGALETVRSVEQYGEQATGVFFPEQTAQSIIDAVARFEAAAAHITPEACRANAEGFSAETFRQQLYEIACDAVSARERAA